MLAPMNHREIEYQAEKLWKSSGVSESQIPLMFEKIQMEEANSRITLATQSLMLWLEQTGSEVFTEDLLLDYGKDCLRCYLMFEKTPKAGDLDLDTWEECSLEGVYKFLRKYRHLILTLAQANQEGAYASQDMTPWLQYMENLKFSCLNLLQKQNTMPNRHNIIAILMEGLKYLQKSFHVNEIVLQETAKGVSNPQVVTLCQEFVILLAPFAPNLSEVLWRELDSKTSVLEQFWLVDESKKPVEQISLPIQINAKTKKVLLVEKGLDSKEAEQRAREALSSFFQASSKHYRVIYVPDKMINFIEQ